MASLRHLGKILSNPRVHRSTGAIAGFASALSVLVGLLAGYATPKGWGRLAMALHITRKPLIMKLAPLVTGVAVGIATAAGLLGFYMWLVEKPKEPVGLESDAEN
jgi:ABC-type spermidine/putrescine transport system permease subunit II